MNKQFTSEAVSIGHPDKLADQISDAILDEFLRQDSEAKVACEVFITDGLIIVGGEAHSTAYVDIPAIAKDVIKRVGYTSESCFDPDNCGVISTLHSQSPDIRQGVDKEDQGAGDQGIMFGYACDETEEFMPATIQIAHWILEELEDYRNNNIMGKGLCPDAKSQVTMTYDENGPVSVDTILVSTQHKEEMEIIAIKCIIEDYIIPSVIRKHPSVEKYFNRKYNLYVNPTGRFVIGGPKGDTGLTGRKIIVDTYGGHGAHGGGAFSGKDSSKVDRSAAYMARYLAKNIVASGQAKKCLVQLSYGIGMSQPLSVYVNTYGTGDDTHLTDIVKSKFDLRPAAIIARFGLKNPIFEPTAKHGHFGKKPYFGRNGIEYFGWEKTDAVDLFHK